MFLINNIKTRVGNKVQNFFFAHFESVLVNLFHLQNLSEVITGHC